MLFFTGDTRSKKLVQLLEQKRIGRTVIDQRINPYPREKWIFDNGAYRDWKAGKSFDHHAYMRRLDMAHEIGTPFFAVLPDVVCRGDETLELSFAYLHYLPRHWHLYLVLQNGMNAESVDAFLSACASSGKAITGLFLGGDDAFKMTAAYWARLCRAEWYTEFHYGRCGTWWKIQHAREVGADSCDSALPLWISSRMKDCLRYLDTELPQQQWWEFYERNPTEFVGGQ